MSLTATYDWYQLPYADPFTIARGTQHAAAVVVVRVADGDGTVGVGGAAPSERYGESRETVDDVLLDLLSTVESIGDPHALQRIERAMRSSAPDDAAARCAVEIACHDLVGKRLDVPLYRYWGLDPTETIETSYTIGIDDTDRMREKAVAAVDAGYGTLKVKLGTDRDRAIVTALRDAAPDATIRVDANEAWGHDEAIRMTTFLADHGVQFVEQPVPADDPDGLRRVRDEGALPVAADESCRTLGDVPGVADVADIAVLKLMKCGGLREALRMIHAARAHDLEVMLGCMTESNASIAAAAHLAPLLDYADLDGSLLLERDPYAGVPMPDGRIDLRAVDRPGSGARITE